MGLWRKTINMLTGRAEPRVPTEEEKRQMDNAAKLAEYTAFDTAVGANPTPETLRQRFREAAYAGHAGVIRDSLEKGAEVPNEINSVWFPPFGGGPITFRTKPLELAAQREWTDVVEVLLSRSDDDNLRAGLHAAEQKNNIGIARTIHAEIARRNTPATDTVTLAEPIAVRKSTIQLKA